MERIRSIEVAARVGSRVRVAGWAHAIRRLGRITFLILRDGWGTLQIVAEAALPDEVGPETVLAVEGLACASANAPGGCELQAPEFTVIATAEPPAVALGRRTLDAGLPVLLDQAVVLNRHPQRRALLRLATGAMAAFRAELGARGFTEVQTPKLVGSSTESGANVFRLDYFGRPAFLAQSPQFSKQALVGVYERVFEVGPVFRAEPHDTTRHLAEYVSMDVECGFIADHRDLMALLRAVLAAIVAGLRASNAGELALLGVEPPEVPAEIPAIHFTEAKAIAAAALGVADDDIDLAPAEERALGAWARERHGSEFLFVTGYPMAKRPFYTHPEPGRPAYSNSFDLLFRGLELVTGGQRLHRHADYLAALARAGMAAGPMAAYLDAFRHGMPPHGGFAIGLERLVMQLTGAPNVRLATMFPRDRDRLAP